MINRQGRYVPVVEFCMMDLKTDVWVESFAECKRITFEHDGKPMLRITIAEQDADKMVKWLSE